MRVGIIAGLLVVLVLGGAAYLMFQGQAKAVRNAPLRLSQGFRQPAQNALATLESADAEHVDRLKAMMEAQKAQANDADNVAMVILQNYFALVSTSNRDAREQKAYEACRAASHSVLEREEETTLNSLKPCFAAAQELQPGSN